MATKDEAPPVVCDNAGNDESTKNAVFKAMASDWLQMRQKVAEMEMMNDRYRIKVDYFRKVLVELKNGIPVFNASVWASEYKDKVRNAERRFKKVRTVLARRERHVAKIRAQTEDTWDNYISKYYEK